MILVLNFKTYTRYIPRMDDEEHLFNPAITGVLTPITKVTFMSK